MQVLNRGWVSSSWPEFTFFLPVISVWFQPADACIGGIHFDVRNSFRHERPPLHPRFAHDAICLYMPCVLPVYLHNSIQVYHTGNSIKSLHSYLLPFYKTAGLNQGLEFGGPVMCMWGWFLATCGCLCVALGMCELSSAYPTSGALYYWMYRLSGPKWGPLACWILGWCG